MVEFTRLCGTFVRWSCASYRNQKGTNYYFILGRNNEVHIIRKIISRYLTACLCLQEKVELILGWGAFIAILGIHNIVITVNRLYGTVDTTQLLTRTLAYLAVLYFPVYVVLWRVIEINRSRRPNTYSLPV